MSLIQLRASLALWRSRLKWRTARWRYWQKRKNASLVTKWQKLRTEAIDRIHLRERQIEEKRHPKPKPGDRFSLFDSVDLTQVPATAHAVAGYVGGKWPTFAQLATRFPRAKRLSIAIASNEDADCLDIENGDATPADAAAWVKRQKQHGAKRPCLYANRSTMPQVLAALGKAGIKRTDVRLWVADWTGEPHIVEGADATQWTDKALGRNLDQSLCSPDFL